MWAQWKDFRLGEDYDEPDIVEQLINEFVKQGVDEKFTAHTLPYTSTEAQHHVENDIKEMEKWGIEVQFYHPAKKDIVSWGKKDYGWRQLVQEFEQGKRKDGGYIQSSLASVEEVLNGI